MIRLQIELFRKFRSDVLKFFDGEEYDVNLYSRGRNNNDENAWNKE